MLLLTCEILFLRATHHGRQTHAPTQTLRLRYSGFCESVTVVHPVTGSKVHYPLRFWMSCYGGDGSRKHPGNDISCPG
jgi:hypothetical protein